MAKGIRSTALDALFATDRGARDLFSPYRSNPLMEALDKSCVITDQPQLRALCAGLFALGLARGDARMMRAGARMLLSHEIATFAKDRVKRRVDRRRPRSSSHDREDDEPSPGHHRAKEVTSFPSGHSAGALAVALAFAFEYPHARKAALGAATALGLARVPTCAHYPSDVAAGWAIGAAAHSLVGLFWRRLPRPTN